MGEDEDMIYQDGDEYKDGFEDKGENETVTEVE